MGLAEGRWWSHPAPFAYAGPRLPVRRRLSWSRQWGGLPLLCDWGGGTWGRVQGDGAVVPWSSVRAARGGRPWMVAPTPSHTLGMTWAERGA